MEDIKRNYMNNYDTIINLPHRQSAKRPHMPIADRAAQFAPFAALTGHGEEIAETARLTDRKMELSEEQLELLDSRLMFLKGHLEERPQVKITFFLPDDRKEGGFYQDISGIVKRIHAYERMIEMESGDTVPLDDVYSIDIGTDE